MKLEIDTTRKTITILEETSILEVMNFLKSLELEDYKIVSKHTTSLVERDQDTFKYVPMFPKPSLPMYDPYNPNKVTCK